MCSGSAWHSPFLNRFERRFNDLIRIKPILSNAFIQCSSSFGSVAIHLLPQGRGASCESLRLFRRECLRRAGPATDASSRCWPRLCSAWWCHGRHAIVAAVGLLYGRPVPHHSLVDGLGTHAFQPCRRLHPAMCSISPTTGVQRTRRMFRTSAARAISALRKESNTASASAETLKSPAGTDLQGKTCASLYEQLPPTFRHHRSVT